jgi:drug/metabolite transporter (DMT)-like permease
MDAKNAGAALVAIFVVAGAARDVYFGEIFQRHRFSDVVQISFGLASLTFLVMVSLRAPQQFKALAQAWREVALANLGTACAWLSYFFALSLLEPAAVNTIHAGMGAVTLVGLSAMGLHISRPVAVQRLEKFLHFGVFAVLLALGAVVLMGWSGVRSGTGSDAALGLAFAFASGVFISLTSDVTKRMHERAISAEAVLAVRFLLMVGVAAVASALDVGKGAPIDDLATFGTIAGAAFVLIVMPLYVLQLGLVRTSAVTTWVIMALGPCLVFALQAFDGRIVASPYTLACILAYSALVIVANVVRARGSRLVRA